MGIVSQALEGVSLGEVGGGFRNSLILNPNASGPSFLILEMG